MKAIVTGMIATYPLGGVAWDYGQYALGLERLGFEVTYLEDTGIVSYSYDAASRSYLEDPSEGVEFLARSLAELSPSLGQRWHVRTAGNVTFGLTQAELRDAVSEADLFINVSGSCLLRPEYRARTRRAVFIDTDPGWNDFVVLPQWDAKPVDERAMGFRGHDVHFSYANRRGLPNCSLPDFGLEWTPTRPIVVADLWQPLPPGETWTTVTMWRNYLDVVEFRGRSYGSKDLEFHRVEDLPRHVNVALELAIYGNRQRAAHFGDAPRERWRSLGWSVINGREVSASMQDYATYIRRSRGEFSVAKNVYVDTRSGWFSCRSVCYLASGRPVVLQDTGWSESIATGNGLFAFQTVDDAAAAIAAVEADYAHHARAARDLACREFEAEVVLADLVSRALAP